MGTNVTGPPLAVDPPAAPGGRATGEDPVSGVDLLQFAQTLCASSNHEQLERRFVAGFGRLFGLPMYALYLVDPWSGGQRRIASAGVSGSFLARYERAGREDRVQAVVLAYESGLVLPGEIAPPTHS